MENEVADAARDFLVDYLSDTDPEPTGRDSYDRLYDVLARWVGEEQLEQYIEEAKSKKLAENGP